MTLDEKLDFVAINYGRDVFKAIYECELKNCPWYGSPEWIRNRIEKDNRIEEYISDLSNAISAECTSDKEFWDNMAGELSSLVIDGCPYVDEEE